MRLNLYIVRHGESMQNVAEMLKSTSGTSTFQERQDPVLSEIGLHQAELLGERLSRVQFDVMYSSPLQRAINTVYQVEKRQKKRPGIKIIPDAYEHGLSPEYPFIPCETLRQTFQSEIECCEDYIMSDRVIEIETESETLERAYRVINYIKRKHMAQGGNVLLGAHGSFNNYLICAAMGTAVNPNFYFSQENCCLSKIQYLESGKARVRCINDVSHLYGEYPDLLHDNEGFIPKLR